MTSVCSAARVFRCPDRLVVRRGDGIGARACAERRDRGRSRSAGSRRRDRGAAGVGQERSTSRTVRSATARRVTARAMPRRTCSPGPGTSRPASSRFGRLPTERSRPIRTSSTSSGAACPTPRCPPGPTCPTRKCRISPTSSRPSPPTSRTPRVSRSPWSSRARRRATEESIELGKKLYVETGCVKCHGNLGRGDGPSAPTLMDDFGQPIRAANLAQSWTFRGGSSREDIFRTMTTGLNGTPMPSFADSLTPEQRWAITDFIVSLSGSDGPGYTNLVVAKARPGSDRSGEGAPRASTSAPVARFPIIGQIMEPGRAFHPPATSVTVQAIYDAESIALLVRWHDMSAEKTGKNGPSLPVPPEEEEAAAAGAPAGRSEPLRRRGGGASAAAAAGPLCRGSASRRAIRVLRRRRDPDSFAGADGRPQALLHLRRRPEPGGSLVLRSGPPRSPSVHRPGKRGHRAERHGGSHRCRELRPGRMVGHLQAAPSRNLGRPVRARTSSCRSPSRSGTGSRASVATGEVSRSGTPSTSSRKSSRRPSARW